MYPTRGEVKARWQAKLDDPSGQVFVESVFAPAFGEAYDALFGAFLQYQVPRIELVTTHKITAGTTTVTPSDLGITDWGDYIYIAERLWGSTDDFRPMAPVNRIGIRTGADRLFDFEYRNDTFYLGGATHDVEIEVRYESSGTAPTSDATVIRVDGSLTFLSNYAVGVAGARKGYDEIGQACMLAAVGPRYQEGTVGGELFRLVQSRVRSMQKIQIAPKPFSARRLLIRRAVPYVAVQPGTTS